MKERTRRPEEPSLSLSLSFEIPENKVFQFKSYFRGEEEKRLFLWPSLSILFPLFFFFSFGCPGNYFFSPLFPQKAKESLCIRPFSSFFLTHAMVNAERNRSLKTRTVKAKMVREREREREKEKREMQRRRGDGSH